jgi:hypothetical protein
VKGTITVTGRSGHAACAAVATRDAVRPRAMKIGRIALRMVASEEGCI